MHGRYCVKVHRPGENLGFGTMVWSVGLIVVVEFWKLDRVSPVPLPVLCQVSQQFDFVEGRVSAWASGMLRSATCLHLGPIYEHDSDWRWRHRD